MLGEHKSKGRRRPKGGRKTSTMCLEI